PLEPVILSPEEAGAVKTKSQKLDPDAGRMRKPLVNDMSGYSLKETYAGRGMRIGTCVNPAYLESPYEEILAGQFNSVTPENHLKPSFTLDRDKSRETGHVTVRFPEGTVKLLDWCLEHRMPVRGHTLIWYMGTPEWLFHEGFAEDGPNVGRDVLLLRMEEYISSFFCELNRGGWEKIMYCIDVVNEAVIAPDRMRKCPWQQIIGDDYVRYAFLYARKYAPEGMKLCYNDFDLENKTDKVIELVNSVTDEHGRRLIDTVGQQGHYGAYSSISALGDALTKIGRETGCELQITELDVSVSRRGTDDELKTQGRFYYDFAELIRKLRTGGVNITGITLWGFADALSWMPSGYLHIYDRNLVPKYAYFGLLGIREYAGFDGTENDALPETRIRVRFSAGAGKYIELTEDGTFVDTTQGGVQSGRYSADGLGTFMLIPASGSYCNLILSADGQRAERVEAAGARTELVRETEA
ncbi:MAG: endo-1,4-beta-xylanase, partial [Clostridia bacterium]|nr:endo-1,4-beta-xylanase [Clostridia bacterium]